MKKLKFMFFILIILFIFSGCEKILDGGEIGWYDSVLDYKEEIVGSKIKFSLPPNLDGFSGAVWGTGNYTYDSAIGTAAVHAGIITFETGGEVTIEIVEGADLYRGTSRNGVTTSDWGSYDFGYKIVK